MLEEKGYELLESPSVRLYSLPKGQNNQTLKLGSVSDLSQMDRSPKAFRGA